MDNANAVATLKLTCGTAQGRFHERRIDRFAIDNRGIEAVQGTHRHGSLSCRMLQPLPGTLAKFPQGKQERRLPMVKIRYQLARRRLHPSLP